MRSPNCSPPEPTTRPPVVSRHALRSTPTESTVACTGCGVHRVREHQVLIAHHLQGVGGVRVLGVRDHVHREPDDAAGDARRRCDGGVPRPVLQRGQQRAPDLVQREGARGQICPVHGRGGIRYGMEVSPDGWRRADCGDSPQQPGPHRSRSADERLSQACRWPERSPSNCSCAAVRSAYRGAGCGSGAGKSSWIARRVWDPEESRTMRGRHASSASRTEAGFEPGGRERRVRWMWP